MLSLELSHVTIQKSSLKKKQKSWPPNIYNAWSHWCRDCEKSYVIDKFISFIGRRIKVLGKHQLFLWCDIIQDWIEVKLDMQSYVLDSSFLGETFTYYKYLIIAWLNVEVKWNDVALIFWNSKINTIDCCSAIMKVT